MEKVKKILAPTDLSELSGAGVLRALEIAKSTGGEVIVYHVIAEQEVNPSGEGFYSDWLEKWLPQDRKKALAEFLGENFPEIIREVRVRQEVVIGNPSAKIIEKAAKEGVDLIVLSTHGRTGLFHLLLGSVTETVVRLASCPVLSIRPETAAEPARKVA